MEFVNGTAILHREETKTQKFLGPDEFRGHGREFGKTFTHNRIPLSTGHQRVVSYRLGGLCLIIHHKSDGYVDESTPPETAMQGSVRDDVSNLLESMSTSQPTIAEDTTSAAPKPASSKLTILRGGQSVTLESTLEIKTRVHHKPLKIADAAPQLWLSQTPRLVRASHNRSVFRAPVVENVSDVVKRWERRNQETLGRLVTLLVTVIAKSKPLGHVSIRYSASKDELYINKCEGNRMFPEDLYQKWKEDGELQKSVQA
jgi:hypothetical protein